MSRTLKILCETALATALGSPAQAQGLVTEKNISLAMAQAIANAAMAKCQEMGYRVSVTVVDRAGLPIKVGEDAARLPPIAATQRIRVVSPMPRAPARA
jgi:hypothetical protein